MYWRRGLNGGCGKWQGMRGRAGYGGQVSESESAAVGLAFATQGRSHRACAMMLVLQQLWAVEIA